MGRWEASTRLLLKVISRCLREITYGNLTGALKAISVNDTSVENWAFDKRKVCTVVPAEIIGRLVYCMTITVLYHFRASNQRDR